MRVKQAAFAGLMAVVVWGGQASAASYTVNASGGGSCGSGSFSPNGGNITVQQGESVTIIFNVSEPTYPAGWDLTSSLWGTIHVDSGTSGNAQFTAPAAGNYTYQGTWPSNGCLKASATITVTAAPYPTPYVSPYATPNASSQPTTSTSPAKTTSPAAATTGSTSQNPTNVAVPQSSNETETNPSPVTSQSQISAKPVTEAKPVFSSPVLIGGGAAFGIGGLATIIWHTLKLRGKL